MIWEVQQHRNKQPLPATSFYLIIGVNIKHMPMYTFHTDITSDLSRNFYQRSQNKTDCCTFNIDWPFNKASSFTHIICDQEAQSFWAFLWLLGVFYDKQTSSVYELMSITNAHALSYVFPLEFSKSHWCETLINKANDKGKLSQNLLQCIFKLI